MIIKEPATDHLILNLITEIDHFKGEWERFKQEIPEQLSHLQHVATIASIGSSTRIEGSELSNTEVEKLLSNLEQKSFRSRDEEEVGGYAEVMQIVFESFEEVPLKESSIQQLHSILLTYSSKDQHHRGKYKKLENNVAAFDAAGNNIGIVFKTSSPFDTPFHMQSLIEWTQDALQHQRYHPLLTIGTFIVYFLAIHPFQDGNGRLSRILTSLLLLKSGYAYTPYCSLESIIELNKEGYYLALRQSQKTLDQEEPDTSAWILFFLQILKKQKDLLLTHIKQHQKNPLQTVSAGAVDIFELLEKQERITISEIENQLKVNRNTLKKRLRELVQKGLILKHGQGKGVWYSKAP